MHTPIYIFWFNSLNPYICTQFKNIYKVRNYYTFMSNLEVNITYETLFDFLRKEKGNEGIQKLPDNFYEDVMNYLKDKFAILEESKKKQDSFSLADHEKTSEDVLSIRKILKELYNRREKKIVKVALDTAMINAPIADTDSLLDYEIELFNKTVKLFKQFRSRVLMQLLDAKEPGHLSGLTDNRMSNPLEMPEISRPDINSTTHISQENPSNLQQPIQDNSNSPPSSPSESNSISNLEETASEKIPFAETSPSETNSFEEPTTKESQSENLNNPSNPLNTLSETLQVEGTPKTEIESLILADIPRFVGRELEIYGPYNKDETVLLPNEIFTILLSKGLVKEIQV